MRKLLTFIVALAMGFAMQAQITANAYYQGFDGDMSGWFIGEENSSWELEPTDSLALSTAERTGYLNSSEGGYTLWSPMFALNSADAQGYMQFIAGCLPYYSGQLSTAWYSVYAIEFVVNNNQLEMGEQKLLGRDTVTENNLKAFSIDLSELNLTSETKYYSFVIEHFGQTDNPGYFYIDNFVLRKNDAYKFVFLMGADTNTIGQSYVVTDANGNVDLPTDPHFTDLKNRIFASWYQPIDENNANVYSPGERITVTSDCDIFAFYGKQVAVKFNGNGATNAMADQQTIQYAIYTLPNNEFVRPGYTFAGWQYGGETHSAGEQIVHEAETDIVLTATWVVGEAQTYNITFDANGGTGYQAPMTLTAGNVLTLPACTFVAPTGMTFAGWAAGSPSGPMFPASGQVPNINNDITFYATWTANGGGDNPQPGQTYTIAFDANGGSGYQAPIILNAGEILTLPACTFVAPAGMTFAGWLAGSPSATTAYAAGQQLTGVAVDVTFYAKWVSNSTDPNGIDDIMLSSVSVYPNPAQNFVSVEGVNADRLDVMDLAGRVVLSTEKTNSINISSLANGVYMLRITAGQSAAVRKIVKK